MRISLLEEINAKIELQLSDNLPNNSQARLCWDRRTFLQLARHKESLIFSTRNVGGIPVAACEPQGGKIPRVPYGLLEVCTMRTFSLISVATSELP